MSMDRDTIRARTARLRPGSAVTFPNWQILNLLDTLDTAEAERDRLARQVEAVKAVTRAVHSSANSAYSEYADPRFENGRVSVAYDVDAALASTEGPGQ